MTLIHTSILSQMFIIFFPLVLLVSIHAVPTFDTTDNQPIEVTTSTMFKQIFEHTTVDQLTDSKTASIVNASSMPIMTTTITNIPNSTATNVTVLGRGVNGRVNYYDTTTTTTKSSSGLSDGAIAGIVIGVIVLICCCGICGCFKEKGHWENARVWVKD